MGPAKERAEEVAERGPLLFPGLVAADEGYIVVNHAGTDELAGWKAFAAVPPGSGIECAVQWQAEAQQFQDPCTGTAYPADGKGLTAYRVEINPDRELVIDLGRGSDDRPRLTRRRRRIALPAAQAGGVPSAAPSVRAERGGAEEAPHQRGRRSSKRAPPRGASSTRTVPPWAAATARTSASPSPAPPAPRARPSSSRVNRSNTRSRSAGGHAGPVVVDPHHRLAAVAATPTATADAGVAGGVVDQVAHEPGSSAARSPRTRAADTPLSSTADAEPAQPPHLGGDQLVEVDVARGRQRAAGLVEPGQLQEVADQVVEPVAPRRAPCRSPSASRPCPGRIVATSTLARIVASGLRSSCEASLTNCRWRSADALEPVEHGVHRVGQAGHLVARRRARPPGGAACCG